MMALDGLLDFNAHKYLVGKTKGQFAELKRVEVAR